MPFVLDNSVVTAWYFENQATAYTDGVLKLMAGDVAHVPALWPLEFSNVLRKAIGGKNITEARAREIIAQNDRWSILVDTTAPIPGDILSLSLAYGLSSYDAAYLDLAIRLRLPIATKDGALRAAAVAASVGVFKP
ncbi:MAG: type II toxin-antitoxin system VapC family toxin [Sterolibacterium sp.]|nr:type II toxin-antitoxin system VapC family toxin [Sterolibacterium sp.]